VAQLCKITDKTLTVLYLHEVFKKLRVVMESEDFYHHHHHNVYLPLAPTPTQFHPVHKLIHNSD